MTGRIGIILAVLVAVLSLASIAAADTCTLSGNETLTKFPRDIHVKS